MERLQKAAIILSLIEKLKAAGNWCGETHIQKAVYFLQEVGMVPFGYEYILYKHGPFSFELRDELTSFIADRLLLLKSNQVPYGPSFILTEAGRNLINRFPKTRKKHNKAIGYISSCLADKGVVSLERLGTALFVKKSEVRNELSNRHLAKEINKLKPHIKIEEAKEALRSIDEILDNARI